MRVGASDYVFMAQNTRQAVINMLALTPAAMGSSINQL